MFNLRNLNALLHYLLASIVSVDISRVIPVSDPFVYDLFCLALLSGNWDLLSVLRVMEFYLKRDFRKHAESIRFGK